MLEGFLSSEYRPDPKYAEVMNFYQKSLDVDLKKYRQQEIENQIKHKLKNGKF